MSNFTKFGHTLKVNKLETKLKQNKDIRHVFSSGGDIKWSLEIVQDVEGAILIYFDLSKFKPKGKVRAFSKFSIMTKDGHESHTIETGLLEYEAGESGWEKAILTKEQLSNEKNNIMPGGILTIYTEIDFKVIPEESEYDEARLMMKLLGDRKFTDVTIVARGAELKAHKAVLVARSPVFDKMFSNNSNKISLDRVEELDFGRDVMWAIIEFIYIFTSPFYDTFVTEQAENNKQQKFVMELYRAADKYQIDDLKIECQESICKILSIENTLQVLLFAVNHHAAQLKDQAIRFICLNSNKIIERDEWSCFVKECPELAMMVVRNMVRYMSGPDSRQIQQDTI